MKFNKLSSIPAVTILYLLTTILLVIFFFAIFTYAKNIAFGKGSYLNRNIPVYIQPYKSDILVPRHKGRLAKFNDSPFFNNELYINKGKLKVDFIIQNKTYKALEIIFLMLHFIIAIGIILNIRRVLRNIDNKTPFSLDNIRHLHMVSVFFLLNYLINFANTVFTHWHIATYIPLKGHMFISDLFFFLEPSKYGIEDNEVLLGNSHSITYLILALFVFAIAQVFKEGLIIKQDNDTIL